MPTKTLENLDRFAGHFVNYLFDEYRGSRHVRRVATWIGLLLLGIDQVADDGVALSRKRQLVFRYHGRRFKARFSHKEGARGGIQIVEYFAGRGSPEGKVIERVTNLREAERVYRSLGATLENFLRQA